MKKLVLYAAAISAFSCIAGGIAQAQSQNVTWQAPATVSGASDVSTEGSYYGSWAPYDGNAVNNNYPVNGVIFQAYTDLPHFSTTGFDNGYNGFPNPGTGNNNYNSLLQCGAYDDTGSGSDDSITWADIPGHTYLIQIWINGNAANRSETITGGANTSATINYGSSGQYIIGTYVADSSGSETITLSGAGSANGNYPQVNLIQIRDISGPNIAWQTPAAISGASDVSTQGTYFGSWAPYASSSLAVNGVTFQNSSDLPNFGNTGFTASNTAFPNPGTANANYNTLLESGAYETPGPACTFSWGGMTPGHKYLLQFWVNGNDSSRTETLSGGENTSPAINYEPGQYIIGTFVAGDSGTETVTLNGNPSDNSPQVNLVQVRDITTTTFSSYQGAVISDNPIGYWPLNLSEDTGGIATDFSGNGNNGGYFGSVNLVAGPAPYITNAVSFSSAEVYFGAATNQPVLNFTGPTTLEAWVQPSQPAASLSVQGDIIAKGYDSANYNEIALRENDSGNGPSSSPNYYGSFGSGGVSGGAQSNTNWVYLVVANDGTNDYLYINSILVQTNSDIKGSIAFADTIGWAIGNGTSGGNGRFFGGNICQVAIYNYGLTSAQVLKHYYAAEVNASPNTSAPLIQTQPQTQESYVGGSVTFSVTALSALPMTNQWYEGSTPLPGQTNSTLTLTNLTLSSGGSFHVVVGNANGTTTSATAVLTISLPSHLEWTATGNPGTWDVDTSSNWLNSSSDAQTAFNQGDYVLFDDTPGVATTVNVSGTVTPSSITVNSSANNFTIQSGALSGPGNFVKEGSSFLTVNCSSGLSGSVSIQGGSVYAGNNVFNDVSSITVTNNSTLDLGGGQFSSLKPIILSGTISNSFSDYAAEPLSITMTGDSGFAGSARWDLASGSQITGPYNFAVDWSGAGYGQWNSVTIGANVPQIIVTNSNPLEFTNTLGFTGMDTSCQNPATVLEITSTNSGVTLYSGGFNGNVNVESGAQMTVASGGNVTSGTIHVYSGGTLYLEYSGNMLTGNSLVLENGASLQTFYNSGANSIDNQMTLNGIVHFVIGDHPLDYTNVISGVGGFVEDYYNNEIVFSASNTYSGPTVIGSSGSTPEVALAGNGSITHSPLIFFGGNDPTVAHIDVSGRSDQTLTLANGQTLEGIGGVNGSLVVSSGAIISPGGTNTTIGITTGANPVGTLAASDNVVLSGTTDIKLDGTTNDMIEAAATITYGGTLNLINVSGTALAAGNSFQIFNAAVYSGSFTTITLPTLGAGLAWNTNQLNSSGIISVVSTGSSGVVIGSSYLSGGNFIFTGTGGTSGGTYYVLTSTNLTTPVSQWTPLATNTFNSTGGFSVTNPLSTGGPQRFYIIKP